MKLNSVRLEAQFLIMCIFNFSVLLKYIPELEVGVNHAVGESLTADTDTLKHTVTSELMHHQVGVNETCRPRQNLPKLSEMLVTVVPYN
jgi:hypothetical protein